MFVLCRVSLGFSGFGAYVCGLAVSVGLGFSALSLLFLGLVCGCCVIVFPQWLLLVTWFCGLLYCLLVVCFVF